MVLGRSVDVLACEVRDECGQFLGNKVYSNQINDALYGAQNVRWWEVYVVEVNRALTSPRLKTRSMPTLAAYRLF
jgi:hypothetical protein